MKKKMNKKAFTLIELIVVIAVVGILVLLGIPRFTGHKERAELARIQYDIKVMEQEIGTEFINNDDDIDKWENNTKDFNQLIQEGKLFEKEGVAKKVESIDETYKVIPEKYKDKINTKLKGTFYTNSGGKVYYEHTKPLGGIPTEPEETPESSDEKIQDLIRSEYIPVATAEELNSIRNNATRTYGKGTKWEGLYTGGLDKQYIQVANVDLSEYSEKGWTPIGTESASFTGTYDGGNYVITDLEVKGGVKSYQGLFGYTEGANISNVALEDINVTGEEYVGGLVGYAGSRTTISNSYSTGSVTGSGDSVGGLVGSAASVTISNSYSTGEVTGTNVMEVGGLVGHADNSTIEDSYATGSVTGTGKVGGLVGKAVSNNKIINSHATGEVTSNGMQTGGLVGWASFSTIENSYSTGAVTSSSWETGGLVGTANGSTDSNTKIINSYATGSVAGNGQVGGLVGYIGYSTIEKSYATGLVTGKSDVGGLVGRFQNSHSVTISNSYWNTVTTNRTTSAGGVGKTTEEMKTKATYSDWIFEEIWEIQEGVSYPTLINNPERH